MHRETYECLNSPGVACGALWRARSSVLVFWLFSWSPAYPLQWAPGAAHVHRQCPSWSPGPSIFRSFFRFDVGLDFGLVLGPFWARLGRLLGPFWEPKSGQVGPKIHLEAVFVQKHLCSLNIGKRKARATFLIPKRAQDGLKTGPIRVQKRTQSHACFVFFDSFGGRLGVWIKLARNAITIRRPNKSLPKVRYDVFWQLLFHHGSPTVSSQLCAAKSMFEKEHVRWCPTRPPDLSTSTRTMTSVGTS